MQELRCYGPIVSLKQNNVSHNNVYKKQCPRCRGKDTERVSETYFACKCGTVFDEDGNVKIKGNYQKGTV